MTDRFTDTGSGSNLRTGTNALLQVRTKGQMVTYPVGSGWEFEIHDGRLIVTTADGGRTVYAPGYWLMADRVVVA